jgi:hypothetical protein
MPDIFERKPLPSTPKLYFYASYQPLTRERYWDLSSHKFDAQYTAHDTLLGYGRCLSREHVEQIMKLCWKEEHPDKADLVKEAHINNFFIYLDESLEELRKCLRATNQLELLEKAKQLTPVDEEPAKSALPEGVKPIKFTLKHNSQGKDELTLTVNGTPVQLPLVQSVRFSLHASDQLPRISLDFVSPDVEIDAECLAKLTPEGNSDRYSLEGTHDTVKVELTPDGVKPVGEQGEAKPLIDCGEMDLGRGTNSTLWFNDYLVLSRDGELYKIHFKQLWGLSNNVARLLIATGTVPGTVVRTRLNGDVVTRSHAAVMVLSYKEDTMAGAGKRLLTDVVMQFGKTIRVDADDPIVDGVPDPATVI